MEAPLCPSFGDDGGFTPFPAGRGLLSLRHLASGRSSAETATGLEPDDVKHDSRSKIVACAAAVGCVAIAFTVRWLLKPLIDDHAPLILFVLAAMVAAWRGGLVIGLLAMVAGGILGDYFFMRPYGSLGPIGVVEW